MAMKGKHSSAAAKSIFPQGRIGGLHKNEKEISLKQK